MTWKREEDDAQPEFDQELADSFVGKYILVGLTHIDADERLLRQEQLHGIVESATPEGIAIRLKGNRAGELWVMPACTDAIAIACPGLYRLRSTGEVVENPDLTSTWTIKEPRKH